MIVSHSKKFVFFHNPKVAGTSFRNAIKDYHDFGRIFWGEERSHFLHITVDLAHLRSWELPCVAPNLFASLSKYRSIVFVRNPERRFISSCFEYFRKFRGGEDFLTQPPAIQQEMIKDMLQEITPERVISDFRYVYFSLQRWYVYLGTQRIATHVLPIFSEDEDFAAAFDILELPRRPIVSSRRGAAGRFEHLICPEIRNFVTTFYASDYAMLDSFEHLRPLCSPDLPTRRFC
jgi:hypothetical protein